MFQNETLTVTVRNIGFAYSFDAQAEHSIILKFDGTLKVINPSERVAASRSIEGN